MGGSIALTLRQEDGTEHRMTCYTSVLPWMLTNVAFIEGHLAHVEKIVSWWADGPRVAALAPQGYGLVVADMRDKVILSCQGYTPIGRIHDLWIPYEDGLDPDSDYQRLKALLESGRISTYTCHDFASKKKTTGLVGDATVEHWLRCAADETCMRRCRWDVDMRPYTIETFKPDQWAAMRQRVLNLGFTLTDDEERIWTEGSNV